MTDSDTRRKKKGRTRTDSPSRSGAPVRRCRTAGKNAGPGTGCAAGSPREREAALASFPQLNPNPIIEVNRDCAVTYANPAAYTALARLDLKKRADIGAFIPADLNSILRDWDRTGPLTVEREVRIADRVFNTSTYLTPEFDVARIYVYDITARKEAEIALKKSRDRFGLLAQTASSLLQTAAPQKMIATLCRQVMAHLDCQVFFNFLADAQTGRLRLNAYAGIPEDEARRIEWLDYGAAVCGSVARDGSRIVADRLQRSEDERAALVRSYGIMAYACHPIMSANNTVLGTLSFGTNNRETFTDDELSLMKAVTDQVAVAMVRMADEQLVRTSEKKYRLLFENMGEGFALYELLYDDRGKPSDWRILEVNDAYVNHTGIARDRIVGRCISEIFPQAISEYLDRFTAVVEKQQSVEFETYSEMADRHLHVVTFPAGGRRFASAVLDITSRRQAEAALGESEERMQQALRVSRSFTFEWQPATDRVLRSASCADILRLSGAEAVHDTGRNFFTRIHPDDRGRLQQVLQSLNPSAQSYFTEYRVIRGDGTIVVLEEIARASFDESGRLARLTGVTTDITERTRAEKTLRESIAELEHFNERMIGRELRMVELKQEVNDLCARLGRPAVYPAELLKERAALDNPREKEQRP